MFRQGDIIVELSERENAPLGVDSLFLLHERREKKYTKPFFVFLSRRCWTGITPHTGKANLMWFD